MDQVLGYQNPQTADKNLDVESATTGFGTVYRERVVLAGPQTNDDGHTACATPGTAVQFATHTCRYVIVTASQANQDAVVIGGANVVAGNTGDGGRLRKGTPLLPNQQVTIACDNTNQLWIDAVSAGDSVTWSYFV